MKVPRSMHQAGLSFALQYTHVITKLIPGARLSSGPLNDVGRFCIGHPSSIIIGPRPQPISGWEFANDLPGITYIIPTLSWPGLQTTRTTHSDSLRQSSSDAPAVERRRRLKFVRHAAAPFLCYNNI